MDDFLQSIQFFYPQILLGIFLGSTLSMLGSFLVIRNLAFFGLTISQMILFAACISLLSNLPILLISICLSFVLVLPFIFFDDLKKNGTILTVLFVFFSSLSQIILVFGGNLKNTLVQAYFGDILTSQVQLNTTILFSLFLILVLFFCFYYKFTYISIDPIQSKLSSKFFLFFEISFYALLISCISISLNLLGSIYSIALLVVPAFTFLNTARSLPGLLFASVLLSIAATLFGFLFSFVGFQNPFHSEEMIYFPTSSLIIVFLVLMSFSWKSVFFLKKKHWK